MVLNPLDDKGFFDYMVDEAVDLIGTTVDSAETAGEVAVGVTECAGEVISDAVGSAGEAISDVAVNAGNGLADFWNAAVAVGKRAAAFGTGFVDALNPFNTRETQLPWTESDEDLSYKRSGYNTGMAANLALAGGGAAMTGHGLATASTCGSVAVGGAVTSETGVGAVVAVGVGICALGGVAEAGIGAVATLIGGSNLAKKSDNYAARRVTEDLDDVGPKERRLGGNGTKNREFRDAGRSALKEAGIDANSKKGLSILRKAHDMLRKIGGCGSFDDCAGIVWDVIGAMSHVD